MITINDHTSTKYVVAHNGADVFHIVKLEVGQELSSGQPYVEAFDTEEELSLKLADLSGNPNYYAEYLESLEPAEEVAEEVVVEPAAEEVAEEETEEAPAEEEEAAAE
jgi:hypothetical protein